MTAVAAPSPQDNRFMTGVVTTLVIVLLLLWWWKRQPSNTVIENVTQTPGTVLVAPDYNTYDVGAASLPNGDFDWMQTTNLACDCDEQYTQPYAAGGIDIEISYPVVVYASPAQYFAAPVNPAFAVYQAPPPPAWWYEPGYNVHHEKETYIYTADGVVGLMGKYSRSAWNDPEGRSAYPQQSKVTTLQGSRCIIDGRTYEHDTSKDKAWPAPTPLPSGAAMSWG